MWSFDSCQIRVHADQNQMTLSQDQVSTQRGYVFFKFPFDKFLVFNTSQAQLQVDFFALCNGYKFIVSSKL